MYNFTYQEYSKLLSNITKSKTKIITFKEYFLANKKPNKFLILRHDVDRKPQNALKMAILENKYKIKSTYYFRYKNNTFDTNIINKIAKLGHDIGYHYECLSDTNGNLNKAINLFETNLEKFNKITKVKTISMHGRPFNKWDNRLIWKNSKNHHMLTDKFKILGEIYLDIPYKDILYINDSGRNFSNQKYNIRDKVNSKINVKIDNFDDIIKIVKNNKKQKIILSFHPERWTDNIIEWIIQYTKDIIINLFKVLIK